MADKIAYISQIVIHDKNPYIFTFLHQLASTKHIVNSIDVNHLNFQL